jgi:hypothetical protein
VIRRSLLLMQRSLHCSLLLPVQRSIQREHDQRTLLA